MTQLLRDIKKINGSSKFNDKFDTKTHTFYKSDINNKKKLRPMSVRSTANDYEPKRIGDKNVRVRFK